MQKRKPFKGKLICQTSLRLCCVVSKRMPFKGKHFVLIVEREASKTLSIDFIANLKEFNSCNENIKKCKIKIARQVPFWASNERKTFHNRVNLEWLHQIFK